MQNLRYDIIPILYVGGTGGNFLSAFLFHARELQNNWEELNPVGHAHNVGKDPYNGHGGGIGTPSIVHIKDLLSMPNNDIVKYPPSHCSDIDLALTFFNKLIKTYFDEDDFDEIVRVFLVKASKSVAVDDIETEFISRARFLKLPKYQALRSRYNSSNVLNISWKDLLYNNPLSLITMLSEFTSLPTANFPIEQLLIWRKLTKKSINDSKLPTFNWLPDVGSNHGPTD